MTISEARASAIVTPTWTADLFSPMMMILTWIYGDPVRQLHRVAPGVVGRQDDKLSNSRDWTWLLFQETKVKNEVSASMPRTPGQLV